jgi:hypothetical protein
MNHDLRMAETYGDLAHRYIVRGDADNAAIVAARAAHFAGLFADTAEWRRRRRVVMLLRAIERATD